MEGLTFFTYPSCTSCRKTKKWLTNHEVNFEERHLFRETPSYEELLEILSLTTEGFDELLAKRSQNFKEIGVDVNDLPISKVVQMIIDDPKLLRRPIITDGKKLIVGYNPDALKSISNKKSVYRLTS
ncbi:Spx/MgsR family RNA polymerase-binding regulatory protein [Cytobacillus spongiae]|jgi:Spx/MgsR family transcriptional regulator|uniref:Spx/MgsR family RNA polymerase-binding regulatory protein n=1 Tax=Cytobacillus spongiae TaxID=2901381 RepID=UPI001F3D42ED|nr:Spx/MgsR family RNA polymerase-binding regulatory protein [Cytobacillus spongiae]UII54838.1 Spx/MgsR family RNA polymerase-binding regulatory protein [Cytobacillus spongiae]